MVSNSAWYTLVVPAPILLSWNTGLVDKGETDEVITYYLLQWSPACQPVACRSATAWNVPSLLTE